MIDDPRIPTLLRLAEQRPHPLYARAAWQLASAEGDLGGAAQALQLGAAEYRSEAKVYARTENDIMLDQIVTGDAKRLAEEIPENSVDMIFTDPIYDRIEDYAWLAETAARILKPGRACLVWCSNVGQYAVQPLMLRWLPFVLPLTYTKIAKTHKAFGYKTFLWSTPLLWFQNGAHDHDWLHDTIVDVDSNAVVSTTTPPNNSYKWHKNPEAYIYWLLRFTKPGDIVYDPFTGSGSLPLCCIQHGRHFIASEIIPEVADQARERIATVRSQPRLPGIDQSAMEFAL